MRILRLLYSAARLALIVWWFVHCWEIFDRRLLAALAFLMVSLEVESALSDTRWIATKELIDAVAELAGKMTRNIEELADREVPK